MKKNMNFGTLWEALDKKLILKKDFPIIENKILKELKKSTCFYNFLFLFLYYDLFIKYELNQTKEMQKVLNFVGLHKPLYVNKLIQIFKFEQSALDKVPPMRIIGKTLDLSFRGFRSDNLECQSEGTMLFSSTDFFVKYLVVNKKGEIYLDIHNKNAKIHLHTLIVDEGSIFFQNRKEIYFDGREYYCPVSNQILVQVMGLLGSQFIIDFDRLMKFEQVTNELWQQSKNIIAEINIA